MKTESQMVDEEGCFRLIGAVVALAISDYKSKNTRKNHRQDWESAKYFLFNSGRLEEYFERYGLSNQISCEYIRKVASNDERRYNYNK